MAKKIKSLPSITQLEGEIKRERYQARYKLVLKSTVVTLITVAAIAVLVATLWLPVLQIYGGSMSPTLTNDDIVVSAKSQNYERGDIIAFYYNNKVLVKRVIAGSGEWVRISDNGSVFVNDIMLVEPYITDKAKGDCDIDMPYQVPEGKLFVMGDHRSVSTDSRSSVVGCVSQEQIVGKIVFRVWPINGFGAIE